ncbi:unnamed protein product [Pylaiella littoralis]
MERKMENNAPGEKKPGESARKANFIVDDGRRVKSTAFSPLLWD